MYYMCTIIATIFFVKHLLINMHIVEIENILLEENILTVSDCYSYKKDFSYLIPRQVFFFFAHVPI